MLLSNHKINQKTGAINKTALLKHRKTLDPRPRASLCKSFGYSYNGKDVGVVAKPDNPTGQAQELGNKSYVV